MFGISRWPIRLWPRSLAARTAMTLLFGLGLVQALGLTIHAFDRIGLQRLGEARDVAMRIMSVYRTVAVAPSLDREQVLRAMDLPPGMTASLGDRPPDKMDPPITPQPLRAMIRANMNIVLIPPQLRPHEMVMHGGFLAGRIIVGIHLPDGSSWLTVASSMRRPRPWHSENFLASFLAMTAAAGFLIVWAVRRLTAPVRTLAEAAEALGRDVNAPPLPETGPTEVATAAAAFNTMAARIRSFVQDRTEMLTAIGHDLRTPITRMKLRAEFIEDDEQRRKMLADLDEMEAMVAATLAFGRDATSAEPVCALDLAELVRTVLDEAGDAHPEAAERLAYQGPAHLTVRARPLSLKRALANLAGNAVNYAGGAVVTVAPPEPANAQGRAAMVRVVVDDDGPGIPPEDLERVFEPFQRLESSRNRETGGVGLGLPIARNILRAHGGDVKLANRAGGGVRATVLLPA